MVGLQVRPGWRRYAGSGAMHQQRPLRRSRSATSGVVRASVSDISLTSYPLTVCASPAEEPFRRRAPGLETPPDQPPPDTRNGRRMDRRPFEGKSASSVDLEEPEDL